MSNKEEELAFHNYAVVFIDLLGQRAALKNQYLLPEIETEEQKQELISMLRKSIGSITALQENAEHMIKASEETQRSGLREKLNTEQKLEWDQLDRRNIKTQRWSDGLVFFSNLGDKKISCHLTNVYYLFMLAGALSLIGLASKRPIRGAIEIAWGVELNPGELYGAAIARSYELESEVAQYPRVVVGSQMINFLRQNAANVGDSLSDKLNKALSETCISMLSQDTDGHAFIHYLGDFFSQQLEISKNGDLYGMALNFISEQISEHQSKRNSKLAFRYIHLHRYFIQYPPQPSS
jgi:hypothetical protein